MPPPIGQLGVNLIGYNHDIGAPQHVRQGLQVGPAHDAAGGVAGEGQHQRLGAGRNGPAQLLRGEAELVLLLCLHQHGDGVGHGHQGAVAHEGGGGDDDLVPRLQQGAEGEVKPLAAAHGDQDLSHGGIFQVKAALQIPGDGPAQVGKARVGGVFGEALLQREDARVPDVPGGLEIRLPDAQGDAPLHPLEEVEVFPNAGGLDILHPPAHNFAVVHHSNTNLSSWTSCTGKIRCFSLYFFKMKWVAVPVTPSMGASFSPTNWATSFRVRPEMVTVIS